MHALNCLQTGRGEEAKPGADPGAHPSRPLKTTCRAQLRRFVARRQSQALTPARTQSELRLNAPSCLRQGGGEEAKPSAYLGAHLSRPLKFRRAEPEGPWRGGKTERGPRRTPKPNYDCMLLDVCNRAVARRQNLAQTQAHTQAGGLNAYVELSTRDSWRGGKTGRSPQRTPKPNYD